MLTQLKPCFSTAEQKLISSLDSPGKIQSFIDREIEYDPDREDRSVKEVVTDRKAECYNGALFATLCLLNQGVKASILEILARKDEEHILCVYEDHGKFGAIAQSKFLGLKNRNPMYDTIRDLGVSYKEFYFAFDGRFSLDSYTNPISLGKYDMKWVYDSMTVVRMARDLCQSKHFLVTKGSGDSAYYVSGERYWREVLVIPEGTKIPKKYLSAKPKNRW